MDLLHTALVEGLRVHPRIAQQNLLIDAAVRDRLAAEVPSIVPFGGQKPHQIVALLDWDHRLPSRRFVLRVHVYYSAASLVRFEAALAMRMTELRRRDLYPEFDVPDFSELPGDESYDVELAEDLAVEGMKLVSAWRRDLSPELGASAVSIVRASQEFREALASVPGRPQHLGDLEAVSWTPPCESGHTAWTVDVWWLTAFDGRLGRGWSFLVDPDAVPGRVVVSREFTVRAG